MSPSRARESSPRRSIPSEHSAVIRLPGDEMLNPATVFGRRAPLVLDVGAGKGRFLLAHAAQHPECNHLGIERQALRIHKIDAQAHQRQIRNIRLVTAEASGFLDARLPDHCVHTCFILFPDPWPKRRHHRRRIVAPAFMDTLHRILVPGGTVFAATDHLDYFEHIRRTFDADPRFQPVPPFIPDETLKTDFELIFERSGLPIGRCGYQTVPPP